ncbi:uncharacterized protein RHOBADRAFT_55377 [Rhodotorula graminis WP1]|uniref:AAA+ ATPase domain-containing protein n=1 Tax=Rhodotorula graminis (strain WP1) TaxID=578459 RepID=A0A0P9IUM8_RHOGW|nr:uncharacterized protein RHOBADRAFT_55377 [Rhodotorula graminis WP1]KPV73164.1 hypothetical protein RHOBADRAFT_55377 [Rhodotorula graminis WP1]
MGRASKSAKPTSPRQFSISSFLPKLAPTASTSSSTSLTKRPAKHEDGEGVLSDDDAPSSRDQFKVPPVPAKRASKAKGKQVAVLDLTEDDEDVVEAPSSSPPPPAPKKKPTTTKKTTDKKGKGKAAVKDDDEDDHDDDDLAEQDDPDAMWVDRFAPRNRDDLALHARKLTDLESWLVEAFALEGRPKHLAKYRRVLVLSGPAGAGKTAALRTLAREMGVELVEWREGTSVQLADEHRESLMHRFASFLSRAGMAPALDFGPDPSDPSTSSSASSSSAPTTSSARTSTSSRRLLLIEDLPNVSHYPTKLALRSALAQYLSSPRVTAPLVLIVSEALARPGDDEAGGGGGGWLSGNGRRGDSVDARGVCGVEVLEHPACREIAFNPVAPTIMRKALVRTLDRIYSTSSASSSSSSSLSTALASRPTLATLDVLVAHSGGDMRSALMSLQFLLTEGEGPGATSIGGGASAAAGGKGGKGKGRKRKRKGESDSEEESVGARGKGKVGKEGVKKLLQFVTARESSLFIFHALGKVLYNKRWGDSPDDDKKDRDRVGIVQERDEASRLPRHLRDEWDRRPSKVDPDVLFAEAPLDADIFLSYLHHNYPPFTDEIDECSGIVDALSAADVVMSARDEGDEAYRHRPLTSLYGFHLGVRTTLMALPSPVTRRKQVLRKSELWETLRLARQNDEGVDEVLVGGALGLAPGQKSMVVEEVVPWLGLINPSGTSPFLLSLSTFPPLSTAAQPLVTGAAIGEKDVSALQDEAGDDEDAPAVDLSEPRRGGRVLQELEDDDDDDDDDVKPVVAAAGAAVRGGERGEVELLFDPDDDIESD